MEAHNVMPVDPFHEAKQTLESARREYSSVSSLTAASAFLPVHACDQALRALYSMATDEPFPHSRFKPFHQPFSLAKDLGLTLYYCSRTQTFLKKLQGYAQDEARYEGTQAFKGYTGAKSAGRAKELLDGAERFITETQSLAGLPMALNTIRIRAKQDDGKP